MRKFVSGLIIGIMISITIVYSAANLTAIQVSFPVYVNGVLFKSDKPVVNIDNSAYMPVRALGEALGVNVLWNDSKKCIEIGELPKPITQPSISNPANLNTPLILDYASIFETYKAEITVKEIIRGDEAWRMVKAANLFNDSAQEGYEYLLAKISYKLIDIPDGKAFNLNNALFKLVSTEGREYGYTMTIAPEPGIQANLYKGSSNEGWVVFTVSTKDKAPKIAFGREYDGTGGLWFKAYK